MRSEHWEGDQTTNSGSCFRLNEINGKLDFLVLEIQMAATPKLSAIRLLIIIVVLAIVSLGCGGKSGPIVPDDPGTDGHTAGQLTYGTS